MNSKPYPQIPVVQRPPPRRVLVVEDDEALREAIGITLSIHEIGYLTAGNGIEALSVVGHETPAIIISDVRMPELDGIGLLRCVRRQLPDVPFVLMTAHADVPIAVDAIKAGAREFLLKPFQPETLIDVVQRHRADPLASGPVGEDPAFKQMLTRLSRVAGSELSVLLSGESGTGKEVLARTIHAQSQRSRGPFVAINCAAIPRDLLEATLFGYEKGAFTGAQKSQAGKFELAHGGTLFLDEIGEMPPDLQAKLLRVLQERVVERVGSHQEVPLDFRLVAATNRRLEQAVHEGRFREDLYFRIGVFPLEIPPLRERPGDIAVLANHFLRRYGPGAGRPAAWFTPAAFERMAQHRWPGNVRELENVVQRALLMADSDGIRDDDLGLSLAARIGAATQDPRALASAQIAAQAGPAAGHAPSHPPAHLPGHVPAHLPGHVPGHGPAPAAGSGPTSWQNPAQPSWPSAGQPSWSNAGQPSWPNAGQTSVPGTAAWDSSAGSYGAPLPSSGASPFNGSAQFNSAAPVNSPPQSNSAAPFNGSSPFNTPAPLNGSSEGGAAASIGVLGPSAEPPSPPAQAAAGDAMDVRSLEREHILQVLRSVNGSRKKALEVLGISERALRYKLKSYREAGHEV